MSAFIFIRCRQGLKYLTTMNSQVTGFEAAIYSSAKP